VRERTDHSSEHGGREWADDFGTDTGAPEDRQKARDDGRNRHQLGTQSKQRSFHDRFSQNHNREGAVFFFLSCDGLFEINHHHHGRLHGSSEQRNEADPDRDGKVVVEKPQEVEAARESERHGQQNVRSFTE